MQLLIITLTFKIGDSRTASKIKANILAEIVKNRAV